jgi:hypothetical protein
VVRSGEVEYLKGEPLGALIACISEGDRQSKPPEGDRLLARDHSIEWMWVVLELISGMP